MMLYINSSHTQYETKVIIHMRKGQVNHHKGIAHTCLSTMRIYANLLYSLSTVQY